MENMSDKTDTERRNESRIENNIGITLTNTLYKVYTMLIRKRLEEEMEMKRILPDNQAGFRKGQSSIDNLYVLHYVIKREIA